ncbi:GNAT family N-acetyltransferase [Psychrobacillus sp. NPDC096426]|uniref:GNAT family N-acetyltransferase n=1 Tax=Psychrobacillus sp. NPDC096426 TaxID=3364491 RepID=UPI0037F2F34A
MKEKITVRLIDNEHSRHINIPNEPFSLFGKMIPSYQNEKWSYETKHYKQEEIREMCFPDENYDFEKLSENSIFLGAYYGEKCVALAVLQHSWNKYMYLYDFKVNKDYRGYGIASLLIDEAKKISQKHRYRGIYTQGQDDNLGACLFYVKKGFEIGGIDTKIYMGTLQEGKSDILFYLEN